MESDTEIPVDVDPSWESQYFPEFEPQRLEKVYAYTSQEITATSDTAYQQQIGLFLVLYSIYVNIVRCVFSHRRVSAVDVIRVYTFHYPSYTRIAKFLYGIIVCELYNSRGPSNYNATMAVKKASTVCVTRGGYPVAFMRMLPCTSTGVTFPGWTPPWSSMDLDTSPSHRKSPPLLYPDEMATIYNHIV